MVQILIVVLVGLFIQTVQPISLASVSRNKKSESQSNSDIPDHLIVYVTPDSAPLVSRNDLNIANGLDVQLMNQIGIYLGITVHYEFRSLTKLLSAVQANSNSVAISTLTITSQRRKDVMFVSYFQTGSGFLVLSSSTATINGLSDLCGKSVVVQSGTTQETDVQNQNAKCGSSSPITIRSAKNYTEQVATVSNGSASVAVGDQALLNSTATGSNGKLKSVGVAYNVQPYGIAVNKGQSGLATKIAKAIAYLISKAYYSHAIKESAFESSIYGVCPPKVYSSASVTTEGNGLSNGECKKLLR